MNIGDLAYIAGIVDGEGCIGSRRFENYNGTIMYTIDLRVAMTDCEAIDLMSSMFGGKIYHRERPSKNGYVYKPTYEWNATGCRAQTALRQLLPYIRVKKELAELALQFPVGKTGVYKTAEEKTLQATINFRVCEINQR